MIMRRRREHRFKNYPIISVAGIRMKERYLRLVFKVAGKKCKGKTEGQETKGSVTVLCYLNHLLIEI